MASIGGIWDEIWNVAIWDTAIWDDGVSDETPDVFTFTDQPGQVLSALNVTSDTITVTGLGVPVTCSFTEVNHITGEYSLNSGVWTDLGSFSISNTDTLAVRCDASASYATEHAIIVTIGTLSDRYSVTTQGDPTATPQGDAKMGMHQMSIGLS